jgi:hypothetical protein
MGWRDRYEGLDEIPLEDEEELDEGKVLLYIEFMERVGQRTKVRAV